MARAQMEWRGTGLETMLAFPPCRVQVLFPTSTLLQSPGASFSLLRGSPSSCPGGLPPLLFQGGLPHFGQVVESGWVAHSYIPHDWPPARTAGPCVFFSPEAGLNWGAPLPGNTQRRLTVRGSLKGFSYQRWAGNRGGSEVRVLAPRAVPGLAPWPGPLAPLSSAGHAVSVYKDLGMMSPFLPDLQLFSLMLCCLGGPLGGGGPALCPLPPFAVPSTPGLYCSML